MLVDHALGSGKRNLVIKLDMSVKNLTSYSHSTLNLATAILVQTKAKIP